MPNIIEISTGEISVGRNGDVISTLGIGSCVAVCLYDKTSRIGGMIHAMLPTRSGGTINEDQEKGKFVDEAIMQLIAEMERAGARKERLTAKLVGGANMFEIFSDGIGQKNVKSAKKILSLLNVPVEGESTGGSNGRSTRFSIDNGIVEVIVRM